MFFNKKIKNHRISLLSQKIGLLKRIGLNFLIIKKFDRNFSNYSPEKFIDYIIFKKIKTKFLYVSKNFKFGKNRKGNIKTLKRFEEKAGFKTIITQPLKNLKKTISSTLIRKKISKGQIIYANNLLGRKWSITGKVVRGDMRGRKIGFPTCNINLNNYIVPKLGVYSVLINSNKFKKKRGIANIGYRPTFNGQNLILEVNIFNFNQNLYDKKLTISFEKFIRSEKKFKNLEQLKKQIKIDINLAKKNV